jgi:alpha-1,2-mannosyltransferase
VGVAELATGIRAEEPAELSRSTPRRVVYRPASWLLPVGCAALVVSAAVLFWANRHFRIFNGMDALVYRRGTEDLWHGRSLYELKHGFLPFTYPPVAAVFFTPMRLLSPYLAAKALSAASLCCLFLIVWIGLGMLGVAKGRGRVGLAACVTAAAMWLEPTMNNFQFGQINMVLLLLVIGDTATSDRRWYKGLGVGLATGVKLVPGLFIVYFLATRRWRAAAVATGAFAVSIAVGFVAAPHDSIEYWSSIGASADRVGEATQLWYVANQSVHGLLLRTVGATHGADRLWLVSAVVVAASAVWLAARAHARTHELLATVLVCLGGALVSPVSWTHHWVFAILLVLVLADAVRRWSTALRRPARAWCACLAVLVPFVFLAWPTPSGRFGGPAPQGLVFLAPNLNSPLPGKAPELHWTWPQHLIGEAYTIVGLVFLIVCAVVLHRTGGAVAPADRKARRSQRAPAFRWRWRARRTP